MMLKRWCLEGFQVLSETDLLCLPIFSKIENGISRLYVQFTFSSRSDYFELIEISKGNSLIKTCQQPANPETTLYYGLTVRGECSLVKRSELENALANVDTSTLSPSALLQFADLTQTFDHIVPRFNVSAAPEDPSFLATLSAQKFVDSAITKISSSAQRQEAVRDILWCSRWVTDWSTDRIPAVHMKRLLQELTINAAELQRNLSAEKQSQLSAYHDEQTQQSKISRTLDGITSLKRQELRLSRLLKIIIDDPSNGRVIALQYNPKTKYEAIVLPLIRQVSADSMEADPLERQIRIATLIPKIFVKYFPIRRGRFLIDFIRTLSEYPHVKDQLANIYAQKQSTYGVALYSSGIQDLLKR